MTPTFYDFFQSIDWSPLEQLEVLKFRTERYLGWEISKINNRYDVTPRASDASDKPVFSSESLEAIARILFIWGAYLDKEQSQ